MKIIEIYFAACFPDKVYILISANWVVLVNIFGRTEVNIKQSPMKPVGEYLQSTVKGVFRRLNVLFSAK